ncbi:Nif11-like leader peptide family natural product precursor [Synechococcus sp. UW179A]|uniref:Nif11-like leader peptide family natural product precursor n=1 Tax=Synechococcus sp. UW179A TaxID=2575510 RepID=UPI000E0FC88B|nr:Nif11-like leader peptide family natural product precursor [Synechococcus sp. UW179A]
MTQEQLTAFIANAKGNTNLQEQLKAAADTNAVAAIAKDAGFSISADDSKKAQSEISDEELEGAAGGFGTCFIGRNTTDGKVRITWHWV